VRTTHWVPALRRDWSVPYLRFGARGSCSTPRIVYAGLRRCKCNPFSPPAFPLVWSEGPALKGWFVNGRERTILSLAQDAKSCAKVCAGLRPMCTELGPQVEPQTVAGAEGGVCTLARAPRVAHPTRSRP